MARNTQDREDLLRDAKAFITRIQLRVTVSKASRIVFAGFRRNGACSIYFDQDPVYHFNASQKLRRAFIDGRLIKSEDGHLVSLTRHAMASEVELIRKVLCESDTSELLTKAIKQLTMLRKVIVSGDYQVDGSVTQEANTVVEKKLLSFLQSFDSIAIADSPRVND